MGWAKELRERGDTLGRVQITRDLELASPSMKWAFHMGLQTHHETESPALSGSQFPLPYRERFGWIISESKPCSNTAREKVLVTIIPAGVAWGHGGVDERKGDIPEAGAK